MADLEPDEFDPLAAEAPIPPPSPGPPPPREADEDEEPPEPEGHPLSKEVADYLGGNDGFRGPLPHDLAALWGHPPARVMDEGSCRILIAAWGVEGFRGSSLHKGALSDAARRANSMEDTSRFKAEREKRKGKR